MSEVLVFVLLLGSVFGDELVLDIGRYLLIFGELHRECGAAGGQGAQNRRVAVELGQRNAGVEDGEALFHVLVHDHAATGVEVAHARTDVLVGSEDVDVVDRLQDLRTGVAEGLLEGVAAGDDEGDFLGVDRVHLTVVDVDADVAGVGTGQRAFLHLGLDTLEDGGHETDVDGTADDAVVELQLAAPLEVDDFLALEVEHGVLAVDLEVLWSFLALDVGTDEQVDFAELACAAGLLLVTVLGRCDLGDGLTVRHLRSVKFDIELELVVDSPLDVVDVLLAHTGKDGLAEFLGVFHADGGILCGDLVEGVADLGLVVLVEGLDGAAVLGVGEDHVGDGVLTCDGQGDVGLAVLELHDAADVAGAQAGDLLLLGARDGVDSGETLAVAGFRVDEVGTFVQGTAHHLEVRHVAEVLLDAGLEDENAHGAVGQARHVAAFDSLGNLALRAGGHVDDELHEATGADIVLRGYAKYGNGLAGCEAGGEALADFVGGELHGVEELLHQLVGTFGGLFHKLGAEAFSFVGVCGGNVLLVAGEVVEFHRYDIHDAFQARSGSYGELAEDGLLAELLADGGANAVPVGLFVVELTHCDNHGDSVLVGIAGEDGGTYFHACSAVHHHHGRVDNLECRKGAAAEIVGTGAVDEVDLAAAELGVERGGVDGLLVGLLEFGVVGDGVFAFNRTAAVDHLAFEEHRFRERGLAGASGTDQGDVADVFCCVRFHLVCALFYVNNLHIPGSLQIY